MNMYCLQSTVTHQMLSYNYIDRLLHVPSTYFYCVKTPTQKHRFRLQFTNHEETYSLRKLNAAVPAPCKPQ